MSQYSDNGAGTEASRPGTGTPRVLAHYAWSVLILSVYGGQVCPYIESLGIGYWLVMLGASFAVALPLRRWLVTKLVLGRPYENMARTQFFLDLAVYLALALFITLFNNEVHGFPLESGLKVMTGIAMLGFFASADLLLERERLVTEHLARTGEHIELGKRQVSVAMKFMALSSTSIILAAGVVFLVISKDLEWLSDLGRTDPAQARLAVLGEMAFIASVIMLGIFNLILSYSRNLKTFVSNENDALKAVAMGDFSGQVAVSTNDEFGVMAWYTNRMIADLSLKVNDLKATEDATIVWLASLAEIRDMETGLHIIRTRLYVKVLAEELSGHEDFHQLLTPATIELLYKSAPLHDIGKVGIPDSVLLKPGRLNPEEFRVMKQHPVLGGDALGKAEQVLGESSFLSLAREIAYSHHEKWDGSGYPKGLKGDGIPLSGRLMALADVYDALVFKRVYKPALSHEKTKSIIINDRGKHFDPRIIDAFLASEDRFVEIAQTYAEGEG